MKIIFILFFLWGVIIPFAFSQNTNILEETRFLKRIENNLIQGEYNLNGKGDVEKLFFGDFNAFVEFTFQPSFGTALGFRIVRNSLNSSYSLELKYVSNYEEANKEASKKYPPIGLSSSELSSISMADHKQIIAHNRVAFARKNEEMRKLFKIETRVYPLSNRLAEKLQQKIVSTITNFEPKAMSNPDVVSIIRDGYSVTFRTVVDNAVLFSLWIQNPNKNILKMAELCKQIMKDAHANRLDEQKYLTTLKKMDLNEKFYPKFERQKAP